MGVFSRLALASIFAALTLHPSAAGVGDPRVATDHPWYPGELDCSDFESLARTQAALFREVTGKTPVTDEEKVLASWLWRNTHYWHGEPGSEDLWGKGFQNDSDSVTRDYWTGLFAHGFGLCGTTHAQWTAEMHHLLGHNRGRVIGVTGHNSFEVLLTGGEYGNGRWVMLDHDVSTVVFDRLGKRLMSVNEIVSDEARLREAAVSGDPRQRGWLACGLYPGDGAAFSSVRVAEYLAGYAGPRPMVYLRRGETLRRYLQPGLEGGRTFVFWGRNYNTDGIPGPERSRTWVNQPERMFRAGQDAGHRDGQARYANAVYTYRPDFNSGDYREGVIQEDADQVTFEFQTPYVIAATPLGDAPWAIYESGGRNGLVVESGTPVSVSISTDRGRTWFDGGPVRGRLDLTDQAKGHRQYWLRFHSGASSLADAGLKITTVCQANAATMPQLRDHGSTVRFQASGLALDSAGPTRRQAETHLVDGAFDSPKVVMEMKAPRNAEAVAIHAAAHVASSNPPSPEIAYQIEYSSDGGATWQPLVEDWRITRRGEEPADFWSQSFCWGEAFIRPTGESLRVRFRNDGGKRYRRTEMHLTYRPPHQDKTRVTFHWRDDRGVHTDRRDLEPGRETSWEIPTGEATETLWVEYEPVTTSGRQ